MDKVGIMQRAKISDKIKGQKIKEIVYDPAPSIDDQENEIFMGSESEIYLILEDGTKLTCWTSEWGGISIKDNKNS